MGATGNRPEFEREAQGRSPSLVAEIWGMLRYNRKWWMLPVLILLLAFGLLVFLSTTPIAPFIYTLF